MIIDTIRARQSFAALAALDEEAFPLDRAALVIASEEYPELDVASYLRRIDTFAARAEVLVGFDRSPINYIESINECFSSRKDSGNSGYYVSAATISVCVAGIGIPIAYQSSTLKPPA